MIENTPAAIIGDLQTNDPRYGDYDLTALNGSSEYVKQFIELRQQENGQSALERALASLKETEPKRYRKLVAGPRGTLLSAVQPEPVCWLWYPRLALGKLTPLDGDGALGKTLLVYDLIARLTTGRPMPGETSSGMIGGAVIISAEDGLKDTIQPRLERAGAALSRVSFLGELKDEDTDEYERPFSLATDLDYLDQEITRVSAKLVLIDPILAFLSGDIYKENYIRGALAPLKSLIEKRNVAALLIRHTPKHGNDRLAYQGLGSVALTNLARTTLFAVRNPNDEEQIVLVNPKNNLARPAPKLLYRVVSEPGEDERPHIVWEGTTTISDQELLHPVDQETGELRREILKSLKTNHPTPMTPADVADAIEENDTAKVNVYLSRMYRAGQITKDGRGMYIALSGLSSSQK